MSGKRRQKYFDDKNKEHSFIQAITDKFLYEIKKNPEIKLELEYTTKTMSSRYVILLKENISFVVRISTHIQKNPQGNFDIELIVDNKDEEVNIEEFVEKVIENINIKYENIRNKEKCE